MLAKEFTSKAEDLADEVLRRSQPLMRTIARLCLVSTFIEDGIWLALKMWDQRSDSDNGWSSAYILATLYVAFLMLAQLMGSALVLSGRHVSIACSILFGTVILQTIVYSIDLDLNYLLRNTSLCGALLLLLAENKVETKSMFAGVPTTGEDRPKTYMQLSGRVLTVVMFATILRLDLNVIRVIENIVAIGLMAAVTVGYKTKLSALLLVVWLSVLNVYFNCFWWTTDSHKQMNEFLKYEFFQTLSVMGGLLMIVVLGPGVISVDDSKKML